MQRLLQIDDDLAAIKKRQRDHAAGALVVNVGIGPIIDPVAGQLDRLERALGQVLIFKVRHYNPLMIFSVRILGRLQAVALRHGLAAVVVGAAALAGCGQKGPLFLPVPPKVLPAPLSASPAPPAVLTPAAPASAAR